VRVKNLILTRAHPKTTHPLGCVVLFMFYSLLYSCFTHALLIALLIALLSALLIAFGRV
jgi:hypothetical protein